MPQINLFSDIPLSDVPFLREAGTLFGVKMKTLSSAAGSSIDLVFWMILFAALLILGCIWLKRLRDRVKNGPAEQSDDEIMTTFEEYYRKKLISYEEYQMIRRNLRDQLVYDLLESEKKKKVGKQGDKPSFADRGMSDSDKEERLRALLRGLESKK